MKDMKTKSYEYFTQIFSESYSRTESDKIARLAYDLLNPLVSKHDKQVKDKLEEFL
jgi:hypothetical protein